MQNTVSPEFRLSFAARIVWALLVVALGLIPSGLFFIWIERNCSLPWLPIELGWPWISLLDQSLMVRLFWNVALFLAFGITHSWLAQLRAKRAMLNRVAPQVLRGVYVIFSGFSVFLLMGLWQPLGKLLWVVPFPDWNVLHAVSMILYWAFMLLAASVLMRFDVFEFLGFRQLGVPASQIDEQGEILRGDVKHQLITRGWYTRMRHPLYFFVLAAIWITPLMSLDRAVLGAAFLVYLSFGIPVEEKKLLRRFGDEYREYQRKVPAVLPFSRFLLDRPQKS